jgi:hypothetical protein
MAVPADYLGKRQQAYSDACEILQAMQQTNECLLRTIETSRLGMMDTRRVLAEANECLGARIAAPGFSIDAHEAVSARATDIKAAEVIGVAGIASVDGYIDRRVADVEDLVADGERCAGNNRTIRSGRETVEIRATDDERRSAGAGGDRLRRRITACEDCLDIVHTDGGDGSIAAEDSQDDAIGEAVIERERGASFRAIGNFVPSREPPG